MTAPANKTPRWPLWLLIAACALSLIAGLFNHWHAHFAAEAWPGFFALIGFAAVSLLTLLARLVAPLLRRPPQYYGEESSEREVRHD
ncbi:hypothetical protein ATO7_05390 [Oceanococcus atlanticus]|uniref:Uncharacterized protein n=1 Tax=Oceanococcus atlanticus TaxID=1317117 RepID=A0A1Y1SI10_9GAMM|nr:hypothetical protein [Oceanococcus atlanticus]ORE89287.1 hypothetical protein ATO7_05390 [Oceanococcus atlanticus]